MTYRFLALTLLILTFTGPSLASGPDDILGIWWSPEQKAKIKIFKKEDSYHGRIIAIRPESIDMKDTENPDETLRDRHILGLEILSGLKFDGDETWESGKIYDPEGGHTYKCKMWQEGSDTIKVRGFIGFSLFGRTIELTRVQGPTPEVFQEGEPPKVYFKE